MRGGPGALAALVLAAVAILLLADLSALSKAEVERIWLPFTPWIAAGAGLIARPLPGSPRSARAPSAGRWWLAANAAGALACAHLILIFQ